MRFSRPAALTLLLPLAFALGACSTSKGSRAPSTADDTTAGRGTGSAARGGGYYLDDGPGERSPADVASIPDAVPRAEPVLARTSRPYTVFGRTYRPMSALAPHREQGMASWYGRRYHGRPTSSGEPYDMYAMTAAHPTLPIPSYVRVTRVSNGRSVVVRVNDRGPFLQNRVIDLSYTAAAKLGFIGAGSAEVVVETITRFDAPVERAVAEPSSLAATDPGPAQPAAAVAANPADAGMSPQRLTVETSVSDIPTALADPALTDPALAVPALAEPTDTPAPVVSEAVRPGFWLQFGAFGSAEGARDALERFRRELAWLDARFDVHVEGLLHKVQAGPWSRREHAFEAAARVRRATAFEPFAVYR